MRCASWRPAARWPGLADLPGRSWPGTLFECGAHTSVSFENGRGDDGRPVFRALLALGNGGSFAHQTCGLNTKRGGDLNVNQ